MFAQGTGARTRTLAWAWVVAQFTLLALLVVLPGGDAWSVPDRLDAVAAIVRWVGIAAVLVGLVALGRSVSPFPVPNATAELRTGGPYALVRHPVYSGLILLAVVWAATSGSVVTAVVAGVFVVVMDAKARWEERQLLDALPGYEAYAARVGRLVPGIGRLR